MQKWEQKQRQKFHESIIENAKPTIKRTENLTKSRQKNFLQTSRSKQLKTPQSSQNSFLPFVKILELFQLQKYSSLLIEHGFPHKLADKKSMKFIDDILDQVDEVDQERFLSLMNTLTIMSKDLKRATPQKKMTQNNIRKDKSSKITHYPPQPPSTGNMRKSNNNLSSSKKAQKNTLFKVRQTNNFKSPPSQNGQPYLSSKFSLSRPSKSIQRLKQGKPSQIDRSLIRQQQGSVNGRKNSKTPKKHHTKNAYDDIYITHSFKNSNKAVPTKIVESNKIIQRLTEKLKKLNPQKYLLQKEPDDLTLELDKIKKMYLSFDSATMTSNINNIDLEEIIECFVEQIYARIDQTHRKKHNLSKMHNRSYLRKAKPTPVKKYIELQNKEEIEYLLKQSMIVDHQDQIQSLQVQRDKQVNPEVNCQKLQLNQLGKMKQRERQRMDTEQFGIEESIQEQYAPEQKLLKRESSNAKSISVNSDNSSSFSEDFQVDYQIQSFVQDFSCFDSNLDHSLRPLEKQDIKNFVQLVVMAGKMQKQMPILAYMYMKKLLNTKKPYLTKPKLTLYNWKNIVLVTLIQASKIWDDTSLENHSFSKVLKPYTTYQINRLEKYFLFYIDYFLTIDQKEYCEAYFQLRRHSKDANKTAHLMSLDIKTIQVLQAIKPGIKKKELQLKEYYRKKMEKSF